MLTCGSMGFYKSRLRHCVPHKRGTAGKQSSVIKWTKCRLRTRRNSLVGVVLEHISMGEFSMVLPTKEKKGPAGLALFGSPPSLFPPRAGVLSRLIVTHVCCKRLRSEHPLLGLFLHRWNQLSL